jgi:hypothetical protein
MAQTMLELAAAIVSSTCLSVGLNLRNWYKEIQEFTFYKLGAYRKRLLISETSFDHKSEKN